MTVGKDVAMLFTDVINCIQTGERRNKQQDKVVVTEFPKHRSTPNRYLPGTGQKSCEGV